MRIDEHIKGEIAVISLKGDLLYEEDGNMLEQKIISLTSDNITKIIFDCGSLNNINSEGLSSLLALAKTVRTKGGDIRIAGLDEHVQNIFAMTKLVRIFDTYETVGRALASYSH